MVDELQRVYRDWEELRANTLGQWARDASAYPLKEEGRAFASGSLRDSRAPWFRTIFRNFLQPPVERLKL
jgi:hypothetical protein